MKKIILASASPRRKELLQLLDLNFEIMPADIDESLEITLTPYENVMYLAEKKAKPISNHFTGHIVIGSDTIVVANNEILGKPKNAAEAFKMLKMLSGFTHQVITGVSLQYNGQVDTFYSETKVSFYSLSDEEINEYINSKEPFDKAGAYGIQGRAAKFIKTIEGDYYTVVGLPISLIYQKLKGIL